MDVFLLQHVHELDHGEDDVKMIGVYSTEASATEAVNRMRNLPGFHEAPDGFSIDRYVVDEDHWTEGYITVPPLA
jgi:hypothetical protein